MRETKWFGIIFYYFRNNKAIRIHNSTLYEYSVKYLTIKLVHISQCTKNIYIMSLIFYKITHVYKIFFSITKFTS